MSSTTIEVTIGGVVKTVEPVVLVALKSDGSIVPLQATADGKLKLA
jgi:hypothetical protein